MDYGPVQEWSFQSTADLSNIQEGTGTLFKAVKITGDIAANNSESLGLLRYIGGGLGANGTAVISGIFKYVAGAAVTQGKPLMVTTSGYLIAATSGSTHIGRSLTAPASGMIGQGIFDFANMGFTLS